MVRTHIRTALAALVICTLGAAGVGLAQSPPSVSVTPSKVWGRVSGIVFDSLHMVPSPGVNVWITGTTRATITDEKGRFDIDSVDTGRQVISFSSAVIDSLGFGTLGAATNVRAGETEKVRLATPSLQTLWRVLCGTQPRIGPDSGIAWGTIQDAATNRLLDGAPALFQWYELKKGASGKRLELSELSATVRTDSTGTYVACGLPVDVALTTRAYGENKASGDVSFTIGDRSLQRIDLSISSDMVAATGAGGGTTGATSNSLGRSLRGRGTAILRGVVRDDQGRSVPDALVSVSSADTVVRTAKDGSFMIRTMPAGTQSVEVRSIGYAMLTRFVNLRPNETTESSFTLNSATTLATFNVRAEKTVSAQQTEFLSRRKLGMGYARTIEGEAYSNALQVLSSVPRLVVNHNSGAPTVTMVGVGRQCSPTVYFDGRRSSWLEIYEYPLESFRSVEVFNPYQVPLEFQTPVSNGTCGVVAYWSKFNFGKVGTIPPP